MNSRRLMIFAVVAAAFVVYANSLWNGFAYDDNFIVMLNERVHQLHNLRIILLTPYWPTMGPELGLYRPFTILAFAVQWVLGGGAPWLFHLSNVVLHAAVCVLVFLLIEQLATSRAAFIGALLFAVHPLHTEAVANVVGQAELWAGGLVLLACWLYARRPAGSAISARTRIAILVIYPLALLFKESAVVLPGLLVLLDFVQRRVQLERRSLRTYFNDVAFVLALFACVLFAYLILRGSVLGNLRGTYAGPALPYLREHYRVLNAFRAWPEFMRLLFVPMDLSVDYAPGVILPVTSVTPMVALGMLLVFAVTVFALATPWRPRVGLVAGWFLISVLPISNFFFPIGVLVAERTLYLPSFAVCFLGGVAFDQALNSPARETRRLSLALGVLVVLAFGVRTIARNPDWKNLTAVIRRLMNDHPEAYRAQWIHATTAWSQGHPELAEKYFQLTERIWSKDSQVLADFGNFYIGQRNFPKAISYLERSVAMIPFDLKSRELLAYAYAYGGRPQDALRVAQYVLGRKRTEVGMLFATEAIAYDKLHQYGPAAGAWTAASHRKSGSLWLIWAMRARSLASLGLTQQALASLDTAAAQTRGAAVPKGVVERLRGAIKNNCYPENKNACDPLAGWVISGGTQKFEPLRK